MSLDEIVLTVRYKRDGTPIIRSSTTLSWPLRQALAYAPNPAVIGDRVYRLTQHVLEAEDMKSPGVRTLRYVHVSSAERPYVHPVKKS